MTSPLVPLVSNSSARTSLGVSTAGNRRGDFAVTISSSHGKSTCNTCQ